MTATVKYRNRLIVLLKELFQLDKPELDFGLYKIMHAKSVQVTSFLEHDLLKEIEQAFGDKDEIDAAQMKAQALIKLAEALGDEALDENGKLQDAYTKLPAGKKFLEEMALAETAKDTLNAESEVYDHLYRFFERYYDNGDFMSRRYYARESDMRSAPYSVPYDGREVYLHWANKDQYYIKSSEYLTNFTFELNEAIRQEAERQKGQKGKGQGFDFDSAQSKTALKVHFRIVDASEGEHGNIKASSDQKRFFIIHAATPAFIENGELVIQFQYRNDSEKSGQDNTWQQTRLQQAEAAIVEVLKADESAAQFMQGISTPAPTDSKDKRTLLGKYLQKYADRNTMDYFIHKDLGGFLRRELDFYIKNEIMRLDDIESADAPKAEQYLGKIRVLRRISHQLIAFLTQLEEFQKKLWLKKKFVTETNYCITLDRIPERFYAEIAANDKQREEWVKLFVIDEIKADLAVQVGYSKPLKVEFLKANPFLLLDTALIDEILKQKILAEITDLDRQCDGVLMHSDNFQALELMQDKYNEQINCIYIDPPYNAKSSEIAYKNTYKHSSWASMMADRLLLGKKLLKNNSNQVIAIDEVEQEVLGQIVSDVFINWKKVCVPIVHNPRGQQGKNVSYTHEYAYFIYPNDEKKFIKDIVKPEIDSRNLRDSGTESDRTDAKTCFYPIIVNPDNTISIGSVPPDDYHPQSSNIAISGERTEIWPLNESGDEKKWRYSVTSVYSILEKLEAKSGRTSIQIIFHKDTGTMKSLWEGSKYDASEYGTKVIQSILGESLAKEFSYPKSINTVEETIEIQTNEADKCLVLDYFAGSGTTAHAVININRKKIYNHKYVLVEQNNYFDKVQKPRILKVVYSKNWKDGKPVSREGISHCFKYLRLESYEDTLNNLVLKTDENRDAALSNSHAMKRDYLLNYFLDVETQSSQSLLNIAHFRDPTSYKMWIKKPGSEEQTQQTIDLIETFNWLIGLWVEHMAAPQTFSADFEREKDADLPKDQNTRLVCKRLKQDATGEYWFRIIEGYTLKVPGDNTSKVKTLIVWRKQTDDAEKDNAALQKYLMEKLQISPRENTYSVIYVNGSHTLPNPVVEGEQTKVRLIEEAFHSAMWAGE